MFTDINRLGGRTQFKFKDHLPKFVIQGKGKY